MFCKIYFIDVYVNTYTYIYEYVYVYIWEYANPFKLTFVWCVFSLGFRFVYVQEVKKYFYSKKWRVVIHIAKGFNAQQTALLHIKKFYCIADNFNAQQKVLPHSKKFYCIAESFIAQQMILLNNRKFYRTAKKLVLWQKLEKNSFCGKN